MINDLQFKYFLRRIIARDPFSFYKINHAHWELFLEYQREKGFDLLPGLLNDDILMGFCKWQTRRSTLDHKGTHPNDLFLVLRILYDDLWYGPPGGDPDYLVGISDSAVRDYDNVKSRLSTQRGKYFSVEDVHSVMAPIINHTLPKDLSPVRGTVFKKAHLDGDIIEMIRSLKTFRVLFVTAGQLDYGIISSDQMSQLKIPKENAAAHAKEILSQINEWCAKRKGSKDQAVIFCCGYLQVYLIRMLHKIYPRTFLIDVGQSFDPLLKKGHRPRRWERM